MLRRFAIIFMTLAYALLASDIALEIHECCCGIDVNLISTAHDHCCAGDHEDSSGCKDYSGCEVHALVVQVDFHERHRDLRLPVLIGYSGEEFRTIQAEEPEMESSESGIQHQDHPPGPPLWKTHCQIVYYG